MQSLSEDIEPAESGSRNHEAEPIENSLMDESMRQSLSEDIQPAAESGSRSHEAELNENSLIDESMGQSLSEDIRPAESGSYDLVYSKPSIIEVHQSPGGITKVEVEELSFPLLTSNRVKGPWGIAVNKKGEIIVADNEANSIRIFNSTGKPITLKNKDQKLNKPCEVAIDASGNILVVDRSNYCVKNFRVDDQHLSLIQSFTNQMTPNRNYWPTGISIFDKKVYVTDAINGHVNILKENLEFENSFGRTGSNNGEFNYPTSVACGKDGKIYVVDNGNNRVQIFNPNGTFESKFGKSGDGEGQFNRPISITIDQSNDMLYISDRGNKRISMFKTDGQFVASFRSEVCQDFDPCGLTVDENGKLYVCEFKTKRVLLFKIAIE